MVAVQLPGQGEDGCWFVISMDAGNNSRLCLYKAFPVSEHLTKQLINNGLRVNVGGWSSPRHSCGQHVRVKVRHEPMLPAQPG